MLWHLLMLPLCRAMVALVASGFCEAAWAMAASGFCLAGSALVALVGFCVCEVEQVLGPVDIDQVQAVIEAMQLAWSSGCGS